MDPLGQLLLGELGEGTRECRLAWHIAGALPAADKPKRTIYLQPVEQSGCGRDVEDGFGDEGARDLDAVADGRPRPPGGDGT